MSKKERRLGTIQACSQAKPSQNGHIALFLAGVSVTVALHSFLKPRTYSVKKFASRCKHKQFYTTSFFNISPACSSFTHVHSGSLCKNPACVLRPGYIMLDWEICIKFTKPRKYCCKHLKYLSFWTLLRSIFLEEISHGKWWTDAISEPLEFSGELLRWRGESPVTIFFHYRFGPGSKAKQSKMTRRSCCLPGLCGLFVFWFVIAGGKDYIATWGNPSGLYAHTEYFASYSHLHQAIVRTRDFEAWFAGYCLPIMIHA